MQYEIMNLIVNLAYTGYSLGKKLHHQYKEGNPSWATHWNDFSQSIQPPHLLIHTGGGGGGNQRKILSHQLPVFVG